jgi:alpha-1,2-mannosyltransferase
MLYSKTVDNRWSASQQLLLIAGVVLALVAFAAGMVIRNSVPENGLYWMPDFKVYYTGGLAILHGSPLYAVKSGPFNLQFTYSPFAGLLFVPLALVPVEVGEVVWTMLNVLAMVAVSWMALDMMHISDGRRRLAIAFVVAVASTLLDGVLTNLVFGQINVLLMLLVFIDVQKWMPRRWCGIATGIAASVKLTPLIFVVYLFLIGRRRGAIQAAAIVVVAFLIGLLILPTASNQYWFEGTFMDLKRMLTATDVEHSLSGFFARLTGDATSPPLWALPVSAVVAIYGLATATIASRKQHTLLGLLIVGFTAILVSPVTWSANYVWVAPALIWLATASWRTRTKIPGVLFPIIVLWSIIPFYWFGNRVDMTPAFQVTLAGNLVATLGSQITPVFLAFVTLPIWLPRLRSPSRTDSDGREAAV